MARKKEFNGVIKDMMHLFNSRNNDYSGYWATGQVYKAVLGTGVDQIKIDVLNEHIVPEVQSLDRLCETYRMIFKKQL